MVLWIRQTVCQYPVLQPIVIVTARQETDPVIISLQPHLPSQRQQTQTTNIKFYSLVPPHSASGLFCHWPPFLPLPGHLCLPFLLLLTENKNIHTSIIGHTHQELYNNFIVVLHFATHLLNSIGQFDLQRKQNINSTTLLIKLSTNND